MSGFLGGLLVLAVCFAIGYVLVTLRDMVANRAERDRRKRLGLPESDESAGS